MTNLQGVYNVTNQGLDIILSIAPQAAESAENPKKAFKLRSAERTASAYLYPPKSPVGNWHVVDYGASEGGHPMSPIDMYMHERGYQQSDFGIAVKELAQMYGVDDTLDRSVNRPNVEWIDKSDCTFDLSTPFALLDKPNEEHIMRAFGKTVKPEHIEELGWHEAEWAGRVFTDKVKVTKSNDNYTVFVQRCDYVNENGAPGVFYKVYEPLAFDKKDRFYIIGKKPLDYIYGLNALIAKASKRTEDDEQPFGNGKLKEAIIVSGGSDAAVCLSMGYQPVYFNSESGVISSKDMERIKQYANSIISIPDVDKPGIRAGVSLALQHMEVSTAWLPKDDLSRFLDGRKRPYKDLKDYVSIHPDKASFHTLIKSAKRAKFWLSKKSKEDKDGEWHWEISATLLYYFLALNGYYTIRDVHAKYTRFVHVDGIKVEEITNKDVIAFLKAWMTKKGLSYELQDTVLRSKDLGSLLDKGMDEVNPDFSDATMDTQTMYFENCIAEVSAKGVAKNRYDDLLTSDRYVWKNDIISHAYTPLEPMFSITRKEDGRYDIRIHSTSSEVFCYLVNASRLHWRKEMEQRFGNDCEARKAYAATHRFCIDGEGLSEEEIAEQKQCLVNKIFAYGYLLHHFKQDSLAWAVICYDSFQGESDACNGRSGKSLFGKVLGKFMHNVYIEAKNPKVFENKNVFANVTPYTNLLFIDECHRKLDYQFLFGRITGEFEKEAKYENPYPIPFEQSPKMLIATNFVIKNMDSSTEARLLPVVFSDYYHAKAENNNYLESRSVRDDFGHDLLDSQYQGWNADINFMLFCLQFYLSVKGTGEKIMPPLSTIERRRQMARMGKGFNEWAEDALQIGSRWLDCDVKRNEIYSDFLRETGQSYVKEVEFFNKLKDYCLYANHLDCINPKDVTGKDKDGENWRKHESKGQVPMVHIRTKAVAESLAQQAAPQQTSLNFHEESPEAKTNDGEQYPF